MSIEQALLGFAAVAGLLTLVPGLDTALVLRTSLTRSRAQALAATGGIQVGTLVWGAAAAVGASALLAVSELGYRLLTLAGAAYLVWLGARMLLRSLRREVETPVEAPEARTRRGAVGAFLTGLGTNLLNPKVGVFYLATIPQFVPDGVSPLVMGLALAGVHCVMGGAWLGAIALGGSALGERVRSDRFERWVDRVTGGVLVALGLRLALTARA